MVVLIATRSQPRGATARESHTTLARCRFSTLPQPDFCPHPLLLIPALTRISGAESQDISHSAQPYQKPSAG